MIKVIVMRTSKSMICCKNPFLRLEAVFPPLMFLARATHSLTGCYVTLISAAATDG